MKVKVWLGIAALIGGTLISTCIFLYITSGPKKTSSFKGARRVTIQKENGQTCLRKRVSPFCVKGAAGHKYIKELVASGGNTIFCSDTSKLDNTLKEAAQYNVAVIIGLDIPGGENMAFYNDGKKVEALFSAYTAIVTRYRDHPALLACVSATNWKFLFHLLYQIFIKHTTASLVK